MNELDCDLADWLQATPIFHGLSRLQMMRLCQIVQIQTWQKDELIFEQDSPATGFFIVKTGRVKVFKVSSIGREQILNIFEQGDDIAINLLVSLSRHSRHLVSVIEDLSFKDVPQRLAAYLLNLNNANSQKSVDRSNLINPVTLDLTKTPLAAVLGTIPATLSRAFYRLSSKGTIAVNGSQIEVLDLHRLQALSQNGDD